MPYKTGLGLLGVARNPANGFPARLLGLYFPPEANEAEVAMMPNAELRPIESVWGHLAGGPGFNPPDAAFVDAALGELPGT